MKHLSNFKLFESNIESTINDVSDILLEFNDNGIEVDILNKSKSFIIMIGDEGSSKYIKFEDYKETLNHLLLYLKESGFVISKGYLTNDTWDADIICPECNSLDVYIESSDSGVCNNCKVHLDSFEFYSDEHPFNLGDLEYFIRNKYWCQFLFIEVKHD